MSQEAIANSSSCGCATQGGQESDQCVLHENDHEHDDACGCGHSHDTNEEMKTYKKVSLVIAGAFVVFALVFEHLLGNEILMMVSAAISIVAGLVIVLPSTFSSLKARSIDINVLLIVAVIGAIYVQAYEEAAAVLFLFSVGGYLEDRAIRKSNDAIKDLAKLAPDTALVIRDSSVVEVATDQVVKGETLILKPGMSAPLDGVITKGASSFNDAAITGESIPVHKGIGETVYAASIAMDGACEIQSTSTVADSTLAKIATMVEEAQKQKSSREDFVQRFAKIYTPLVIVAAILVALIPPLVSASGFVSLGDFNTWIYRACELLVISCPCAFVISTPVTMVSALTRAAKFGVLVKGGAFFEEGAQVSVVAFDKTGTLTEGKPIVTKMLTLGDIDTTHSTEALAGDEEPGLVSSTSSQALLGNSEAERSLLGIAAALEAHSTHPLGSAVLKFAEDKGIALSGSVDMIKETAGKGVSGTIDGVEYAIGSQSFIEGDLGISEGFERINQGEGNEAATALYVAERSGTPRLLGVFFVADAIRESSSSALKVLRKVRKHLKTVMLTGDNEKVAKAVAYELGVDEVHAGLLPQDKTSEIKQLQLRDGSVAFVGDGINDTPSLATANVGIAMGGAGSSAALSSADVVLMADDLSALPKFLSLSTKTINVLKQNIVLAIGLKVFVALLVVFGVAQMWMAVLADTGVSLLVIINGMRLLRMRL